MVVYTIGHSSHPPERFLALLREHRLEVLVDTRSSPCSRYSPQFDREPLRELVSASGIKYLFLGDALGGRPRDEACYDGQGRVLYGRVANQPDFLAAIDKLWTQMAQREHQGANLLGGYRDCIAAADLRKKPVLASLALIIPEDLWWWVREENGKRKNRALFQRNRVTYNLAVTDPRWIAQMNLLPAGIYPHRMLVPAARQTWLTVSLGEAFQAHAGAEAFHYRIVAAVIVRQ